MAEIAYVYILASSFEKLYIGITTELEVRVAEHKSRSHEASHTAHYRINKLVYFERFSSVVAAITHEKQLKRWSRIKKLRLIITTNPTWLDLSSEWGKPIAPYKETP